MGSVESRLYIWLATDLTALLSHRNHSESYEQKDRNDLAARNLLTCLLSALFPQPLTPGGCSLKTTKIVLGN
jgi:hypothetical protein